ncbi:PREDICTED: uncharacterized protein LOC109486186 isoform X1 [Branchiostoma belcheri]|uniref:Uncharacterized protein LOC109486186 isoform X1 n=1 Tax=Branchiostoma belcheri TaxID=7741 RepID=A0A6P5A7C3_BRABE|nr:PREDICTED: uncharacterized protein LOC109486186 isoform X1 [Branchiostoma belcheri]
MATGVQNKVAARQLPGLRMPLTTVMLFTGVLLILLQPTASQPEQSLLARLTDKEASSNSIEDTTREALVDGGHARVARAALRCLRGRCMMCVRLVCERYCGVRRRPVCCKYRWNITLC